MRFNHAIFAIIALCFLAIPSASQAVCETCMNSACTPSYWPNWGGTDCQVRELRLCTGGPPCAVFTFCRTLGNCNTVEPPPESTALPKARPAEELGITPADLQRWIDEGKVTIVQDILSPSEPLRQALRALDGLDVLFAELLAGGLPEGEQRGSMRMRRSFPRTLPPESTPERVVDTGPLITYRGTATPLTDGSVQVVFDVDGHADVRRIEAVLEAYKPAGFVIVESPDGARRSFDVAAR
ncbi:MAG: hypothetical protein AAF772_00730 [Acidobacteriota bacterium]